MSVLAVLSAFEIETGRKPVNVLKGKITEFRITETAFDIHVHDVAEQKRYVVCLSLHGVPNEVTMLMNLIGRQYGSDKHGRADEMVV